MDPFAGIVPFVHVAEERSFRRAAERLGVTSAAVSKAVKLLEDDLGVRLLERTSRHVSLTPEGEALLARAREAVSLVRAGREAAAQAQREPRGEVVVSLPMILSRLVAPACARLRGRHTGLKLKLRFSDRLARFDAEGVDLALRMGELDDSTLVARKLLQPRWVTVASPAYLGRSGTPQRPTDLARHAAVKFVTPRGTAREWSFLAAPGHAATQEVFVEAAVDVDYGEALLDAALEGVGLAQVLDFMVAAHLRDGRLVEVLGGWAAPGPAISVVYPQGRLGSLRVRAVVDALVETLRPQSARRNGAA